MLYMYMCHVEKCFIWKIQNIRSSVLVFYVFLLRMSIFFTKSRSSVSAQCILEVLY
jgi:hypothetical protein